MILRFFHIFIYLICIGHMVFALNNFPEDILDMTCVNSRIAAPDIQNGYIVKYDRKNINGKAFVTALYSCDENFDFQNSLITEMYCSKEAWIGDLPECKSLNENYDDYEDSDDITNEHYDSEETNLNIIEENSDNTLEVIPISNPISNETEGYNTTAVEQCPSNHDCEHICNVFINSEENFPTYACQCNPGFTLGNDRKSCIDIDECVEKHILETCKKCENSPGSYTCIEDDGIDVCLNNNCQNAVCNAISNENFECVCLEGYTILNSTSCRLRDCRDDGCPLNQDCKEIESVFECIYKDPCEVNRGGCSYKCTSALDHAFAICECPESQILLEDKSSCGCPPNTSLNEDQICQPIASCKINNGNCEQLCESSKDGISCSCLEGFKLINTTQCVDINECLDENICEQECVNYIGSFECKCKTGYVLNEENICIDINECNSSPLCEYECINLPGSFKCDCPPDFLLNEDKLTCSSIKTPCIIPIYPENGSLECSGNNTDNINCTISCDEGYILNGHSTSTCHNGVWSGEKSNCIPISCPNLPKPTFGIILPTKCSSGESLIGERCTLHCFPGYIPKNKRAAICQSNQTWSVANDMDCVKIRKQEIFLKCPQNTTIILKSDKKDVHVRLEKPKTNVKQLKLKSFPSWAQSLNAQLKLGVHRIEFRAYSDDFSKYVSCITVITVKKQTPPKVIFCPQSFEINVDKLENGKSLTWKEPIFDDMHKIVKVYKSRAPGEFFVIGNHKVFYEVTNEDGLTSRCEFSILVKSTKDPHNKISSILLDNHDSFLICEGQPPIKISAIKIHNIPSNCLVKNVKINPLSQILKKRWLIRNYL